LGRRQGGRRGASGARARPAPGRAALGWASDGEAVTRRAVPGPGQQRGRWHRVGLVTGRLERSGRRRGRAGGGGDGGSVWVGRRRSGGAENQADDVWPGGARNQADGNCGTKAVLGEGGGIIER
jgi:hypothetical protein